MINATNWDPTASTSADRLVNDDDLSPISSDVISSVNATAKVASMKAIARSNSDASREYCIYPLSPAGHVAGESTRSTGGIEKWRRSPRSRAPGGAEYVVSGEHLPRRSVSYDPAVLPWWRRLSCDGFPRLRAGGCADA